MSHPPNINRPSNETLAQGCLCIHFKTKARTLPFRRKSLARPAPCSSRKRYKFPPDPSPALQYRKSTIKSPNPTHTSIKCRNDRRRRRSRHPIPAISTAAYVKSQPFGVSKSRNPPLTFKSVVVVLSNVAVVCGVRRSFNDVVVLLGAVECRHLRTQRGGGSLGRRRRVD